MTRSGNSDGHPAPIARDRIRQFVNEGRLKSLDPLRTQSVSSRQRAAYERKREEEKKCEEEGQVQGYSPEQLELEVLRRERDWLLGAWAAAAGIHQGYATATLRRRSARWREEIERGHVGEGV